MLVFLLAFGHKNMIHLFHAKHYSFPIHIFRERDKDNDGKLNFQENFHGLFDSIRNYEEAYNQSDSMEAPANKLFKELDKDNDGYMFKFLLVQINSFLMLRQSASLCAFQVSVC